MTLELDTLDRLAASAFDGYLVRKDLVRKYCSPVPGADVCRGVPAWAVLRHGRRDGDRPRACRSSNDSSRTEPSGRAKKSCSRQRRATGSVKLIDIVKAKLDAKNDCYVAELPSLALKDVRIDDNLVDDHERMLTDGFYAEVTLEYDAVVAQEKNGRPFRDRMLCGRSRCRSRMCWMCSASGRQEYSTRASGSTS